MFPQRVHFLFFVFKLFCPPLFGQFSETFSDGNFTSNPAWLGDSSAFKISATGELQLNATSAGESVLAVPFLQPDSLRWQFQLKMEFAPSASNRLRVYLSADRPDLKQARGYYLELGENGSADAIHLYRQDGPDKTTKLASGQPGVAAADPLFLNVRVERNAAGRWWVSAGEGSVTLQFETQDAAYLPDTAWFGFHCLYTSTRRDKFYFDNIFISENIPDTQPPVLLDAVSVSRYRVDLQFDEALDGKTVTFFDSYHLNNIQPPETVIWTAAQPAKVGLVFAEPFRFGLTYLLDVKNLTDEAGNKMTDRLLEFTHQISDPARQFDVIITEVMSDPSPSAGLPEVEWVELYNASDRPIELGELYISDNNRSDTVALPAFVLEAGAYVVLTTPAAVPSLKSPVCPVLAVSGFPSLNNEGDAVYLSNQEGELIDWLVYDLTMHESTDKTDGGWSLERIYLDRPCLGRGNWTSCPNPPGGTPGQANGAARTDADNISPSLLSLTALNADTLLLHFSEGLDESTVSSVPDFYFEPELAVASVTQRPEELDLLELVLAERPVAGKLYQLHIAQTVQDCAGNALEHTEGVYHALPETPEPGEVVINELLFNPESGGSRFLELYNSSDKVFLCRHFFISTSPSGAPSRPVKHDRLFFPGEYLTLTANPDDIRARFHGTRFDWLLKIDFPTLSDDEGHVGLYWSDGFTTLKLDSLDYHSNWHSPLLTVAEREGISLERIRTGLPTSEASNWISSAEKGTPTRANSQGRSAVAAEPTGVLHLPLRRFSPDGDGREDVLEIFYTMPEPGFAATCTVYDAGGTPVRKLARQELLGTTGVIRWAGDTEGGEPALPGIYIVWMETFSPNGSVQRSKEAVALVYQNKF